ncbi:hypothetical protein TM7_0015 [candidate division TM7 genomosp. GTL1]|nr:hypothetical protein TM7_0015 [candidate division TM7 genomosp. GTL1]
MAWSATETNTVYACVGDASTTSDSGFLVSTDGGKTWTLRSSTVHFAGNHAASPLPTNHPRSTGNLLAQGGGFIYAATYSEGVFRSNDNGATWTNIGFSGGTHYGRSIVIDPNDSNTLYVALYNENVWKCTNAAAGSPSWTQLTTAPAIVEEMRFVETTIYAACGSSGIYRTTDGGTTWDSLNGSFIDTTQSMWQAVDGYVSGSNHIVFFGCDNGITPGSDGARSIVKVSIDNVGSIGYTDVSSTTANVDLTIPPEGRSWWYGTATSFKDWLSGSSFFTPGYILIDPANTNRMWVAGSQGIFRSTDGGTHWRMAVNGMPLSGSGAFAFDPGDGQHLLVTTTDWTVLDITDGIANDASSTTFNPPSKAGKGYSVTFDSSDRRAFLGVGNRDTNTEGQIFSRAVGETSWTDEGEPAAAFVHFHTFSLYSATYKVLLSFGSITIERP